MSSYEALNLMITIGATVSSFVISLLMLVLSLVLLKKGK
ncbi:MULTISPECIES: putative holin-like toxin [Shouchella]|uniref:Holin-like toxin n=1 Tax=Shouchella lehensis G1 TaxID=1246626 RepID=A0A060M0M6_9BACI|nr:hypothetical protein BleG1_3455 [Shouchella lehensis G1]